MPELNGDVPVFNCFVRAEYLYDLKSYHGKYEECTVFGITSIQGRPLGFRILTERGAQISNLPPSALVTKPHEHHLPLHHLQMWDCYDSETEVLTYEGWKKFPDVCYSDALATVNLENDLLEYQKPSLLVEKDYTGPMVRVGGGPRQRLDLLVTPNHRMVVYKAKQNLPSIRKASNLRKTDTIKLTCGWEGIDRNIYTVSGWTLLGNPGKKHHAPVDVDAVLFAEFLGWYIAEGCCAENPCRVFISQIPGPGRDKLRILLDKLPWKWHNTGTSVSVVSRQLCQELKKFGDSCYNKRVPQWIKNSSPRIIRAFLDGAVAGDGWFDDETKERYATVNPELAGDIQELYLKLGHSCNIRHRHSKPYNIRGRYGENTSDQYWAIQNSGTRASLISHGAPLFRTEDYEGKVYCATVPNGTLIVRRNGKMIICGNCFSYDFSVVPFSWLSEMRCQVILRDRQILEGTYYATVGWYGNNDSEEPGEAGLKDGHIVFLDCGCITCQPNSRIIFHEPSFITNPYKIREGERPDYLTQTYKFKCEIDSRWTAEDSYKMFYDDNDLDGSDISQADRVELSRLRALKDVNHPDYEKELEKWEKSKLVSGQAAEKRPSRER